MKKHSPFCTRAVDENGDALLFQAFVNECVHKGILEQYDIFVVESNTIHFQGKKENDLQALSITDLILLLAVTRITKQPEAQRSAYIGIDFGKYSIYTKSIYLQVHPRTILNTENNKQSSKECLSQTEE